jgi:hypothetical protein
VADWMHRRNFHKRIDYWHYEDDTRKLDISHESVEEAEHNESKRRLLIFVVNTELA